jgi:hypothetical protein
MEKMGMIQYVHIDKGTCNCNLAFEYDDGFSKFELSLIGYVEDSML